MVTRAHKAALSALLLTVGLVAWPRSAQALLAQTASDLDKLQDTLTHRLETEPGLRARVTPMLLATPIHHWVESRDDFQAAAIRTIKAALPGTNDVIMCADCDTWRLDVRPGQGLVIDNGELSLAELGRLSKDPRYGGARSLALVRETPAGVECEIIALADGRILFSTIADSTARLTDIEPYLHFDAERDRRLRGEALSYVFVNLGLYPHGLAQLEYVEQWGDRNQHITGVGLSLYNPTLSLGIVYHYMLPWSRRFHVSAAAYLPLQNAAESVTGKGDASTTFVAQAMAQYAFANSYAVFASISTEGNLSVGLNFYNPLFLPFLL